MAEPFLGELPEGTKRCRVCAEPINQAAKKCIHCGADQDWKVSVGLSATVLSLLVALISVLTAAIPVLTEALSTKNSNLTITFGGTNGGDHVNFLVSNSGTRPGSIDETGRIECSDERKIMLYFVRLSEYAVIEPGKTVMASFQGKFREKHDKDPLLSRMRTPNTPPTQQVDCVVHLVTTDFKGENRLYDLKIRSELLSSILRDGRVETP